MRDDHGDLCARIVRLEERLDALDRLIEAKMAAIMADIAKTDLKVDERFSSHNLFREQIREERAHFATKGEVDTMFRWLLGTFVVVTLALGGWLALISVNR